MTPTVHTLTQQEITDLTSRGVKGNFVKVVSFNDRPVLNVNETITRELLSALKRLVLCQGSEDITYSVAYAKIAARAAIAKAEST